MRTFRWIFSLLSIHCSTTSEVFASDNGCNLFALDLRNGRVLYSYKGNFANASVSSRRFLNQFAGISGSVVSMAPLPQGLASAALDQYTRIHTTFPPPTEMGRQQERKGQVLQKIFMKSTPTFVVWDRDTAMNNEKPGTNHDDVWEKIQNV